MITINYENTIDNLYELDKNEMPLYFSRETAIGEMILNDPRQVMGRIIDVPMPKMDEKDMSTMEAMMKWLLSQ